MGLLINGEWHDTWYDTEKTGGKFVREDAAFRNWITEDGAAGPTGKAGFKAEADRYHLYVALACPWAHRTLIFRKLKGLEEIIPVSIVEPLMLEHGWTFAEPEPINGANYMWQVYTAAKADYTGRVTVPVLWDKKLDTIVSNESSEIIRMFNSAFNGLTGNTDDYCPDDRMAEIDALNTLIYDTVNNGVYKAGFATTQAAYEDAVTKLFDTLAHLEARLSKQRYLLGDTLTEADWRLFTTLVRFDPVYVGHFKCNIRRISDYAALSNYVRDLYQTPGVAETVDFDAIKAHYYGSHKTINPTGVIPFGPAMDLTQPHNRDTLGPRQIHQRGAEPLTAIGS